MIEISRAFAPYNMRRYGRPWGAVVTFPNKVKPTYDFSGHWDGECVVMMVEAGSIVAFGQRDHRGNNTSKTFFVVGESGDLTEVTEGDARKFHNARDNG